MKRLAVNSVVFISLPLVILVTAIIHRPLTFSGKRVTVWLNEIRIGQPSPAVAVFQKMGAAGVASLRNALKSDDVSVRMKAAWVLGRLGPMASNAVPDLIQSMDDEASNVEIVSIQSLKYIGASQTNVIPKLLSKLSSTNLGVSNSAADWLNRILMEGEAGGICPYADEYEVDIAFLHSSSQRVRLFGLVRLMHFSVSDDRVASTLRTLLDDTNSTIREQTAVFLNNPGMAFTDSSVSAHIQE